MSTTSKTISALACLFIILLPRIGVSHGVVDVSLGAAQICWAADVDAGGGEGSLWRQGHLVGSLSPMKIVCQIPHENRRILTKVWVRASNIDGFSGSMGCFLESANQVTNDVFRGEEVRPSSGREEVSIALPVPTSEYRVGYWLVQCELDGRSVVRGIRYIYR